MNSKTTTFVVVICLIVGVSFAIVAAAVALLFPGFSETAMGVLQYLGTLLCGTATVYVASKALTESKRANDLSDDLATSKRRQEIAPYLTPSVENRNANWIELHVTNQTGNPALGVLFNGYDFVSIIRGGKAVERFVSFGKCEDHEIPAIAIPASEIGETDEGYPRRIELIYCDIDNNVICQTFALTENYDYVQVSYEYSSVHRMV